MYGLITNIAYPQEEDLTGFYKGEKMDIRFVCTAKHCVPLSTLYGSMSSHSKMGRDQLKKWTSAKVLFAF